MHASVAARLTDLGLFAKSAGALDTILGYRPFSASDAAKLAPWTAIGGALLGGAGDALIRGDDEESAGEGAAMSALKGGLLGGAAPLAAPAASKGLTDIQRWIGEATLAADPSNEANRLPGVLSDLANRGMAAFQPEIRRTLRERQTVQDLLDILLKR